MKKKTKQKEESSDTKLAKAQIALLGATVRLRQFVDQFERLALSLGAAAVYRPRKKRR